MSDPKKFKVIVEKDVMIPMRDGIHLAADIYHPSIESKIVENPLPALIERTPYGKRDPILRTARATYFAQHGYNVVIQDCRGCDESEGTFGFLSQEPEDGYDTVEWIAAQPWCEGRVGTFGSSYGAWFQLALATQAPPHLGCMIPTMGGWNAHTSSVRQGGAFELRWLCWAFFHSAHNAHRDILADPFVVQALNECDIRDWLPRLPIRRGQTPLKLVPNYEKYLFDMLSQGEYNTFWQQPGFAIEEYADRIPDVPILFCGGWYDSYTRSTMEAFVKLRSMTDRKAPVKVLMGPWSHGTYVTELSYAGDADFGPEAALASFDNLHLRWFDRWLKEVDNGVEKMAPVRIFVMGGGDGCKNKASRIQHGGQWRDENEWPPKRTRYVKFYLRENGRLSEEKSEKTDSSTIYQFDPNNPVPTVGGNFSSLKYVLPIPKGITSNKLKEAIPSGQLRRQDISPAGPFDQRERDGLFGCKSPYLPLSSRPDVIVFETDQLIDDLEVTGPIKVNIWVSSSAKDTDFTAKLIDCYPPGFDYPEGYAMNMGDSIIRARFWQSRSSEELLEAGRVYPLTITLYPTSNLFKKGHVIRLDISSSNFPRFDVNPNTGEPVGEERSKMVAINTLHYTSEYPSHIILPVVDA